MERSLTVAGQLSKALAVYRCARRLAVALHLHSTNSIGAARLSALTVATICTPLAERASLQRRAGHHVQCCLLPATQLQSRAGTYTGVPEHPCGTRADLHRVGCSRTTVLRNHIGHIGHSLCLGGPVSTAVRCADCRAGASMRSGGQHPWRQDQKRDGVLRPTLGSGRSTFS